MYFKRKCACDSASILARQTRQRQTDNKEKTNLRVHLHVTKRVRPKWLVFPLRVT